MIGNTERLIVDVDIVQVEARDQNDAIEKFIDIALQDIEDDNVASVRLFLTDFILENRHYFPRDPNTVRFNEIRTTMAQEYNDSNLGDDGMESDDVSDFIRRHRADYKFLLTTSIDIQPMYFNINEFVLHV